MAERMRGVYHGEKGERGGLQAAEGDKQALHKQSLPAEFNLGEDMKVMLLAVTEGEDKPLKYPLMFRLARALVINKVDLLPYVQCRIEHIIRDARSLNPDLQIFQLSCTTMSGLPAWKDWLTAAIRNKKRAAIIA